MPRYFQAIAIDYDGTLVENSGPPDPELLLELRRVREDGRKLVLVTGRILDDLRRVFPDVDVHFDAIVAENGTVLVLPGSAPRAMFPPVPGELISALARAGIPARRGDVLIETDAANAAAILAELEKLGLELTLVRNRGRLMVLPPGASKGEGLFRALGELRISHHNVIAIGDAENDHSLLEVAELGVAVGNAIPSLKESADVVLDLPAGLGVRSFLRASVRGGELQVIPKRWFVRVGKTAPGAAALFPGSRANVLIAGGSGSGKSHFAGLLAERLIEAGYSIVVLDPEGDHDGLASLRGVVCLGNPDPLPPPEYLRTLLKHRFGSVICDLSLLPPAEKTRWIGGAVRALDAQRRENGLPHWIFVDGFRSPASRSPRSSNRAPVAGAWSAGGPRSSPRKCSR
jgi:hydroxymethylpyrimidine pyrophosphatase-like HAD family hydrolase